MLNSYPNLDPALLGEARPVSRVWAAHPPATDQSAPASSRLLVPGGRTPAQITLIASLPDFQAFRGCHCPMITGQGIPRFRQLRGPADVQARSGASIHGTLQSRRSSRSGFGFPWHSGRAPDQGCRPWRWCRSPPPRRLAVLWSASCAWHRFAACSSHNNLGSQAYLEFGKRADENIAYDRVVGVMEGCSEVHPPAPAARRTDFLVDR